MSPSPGARFSSTPLRLDALLGTLTLLFGGACSGAPRAPDVITPENVSYQRDVQPLWDARCNNSACHGGPEPGLDLTAGAAHRALVGAPSRQAAGYVVVRPGSPDDSLLWLKLTDRSPKGDPMPPRGAPLRQEALEVIEAWIRAGAPDN